MFAKKWKYGVLRFIRNEDTDTQGWYFAITEGNRVIDEKLEEANLSLILDRLGKKGWELVAIDPVVGFVFKAKRR